MSEEFEKIIIERFDNLDNRMDSMNQKMDNMNAELNKKMDNMNVELNEKMDNMNAELNRKIDNVEKKLTNRIDDLSGNVAVLEYKLTTELPAVYEAHTINYDIQKINEKKLNSVLETSSINSMHITHLYETVRDHEKKLNELIS